MNFTISLPTYLDFKIHIDNYFTILESFKDFQLLDFDAVNFILRLIIFIYGRLRFTVHLNVLTRLSLQEFVTKGTKQCKL